MLYFVADDGSLIVPIIFWNVTLYSEFADISNWISDITEYLKVPYKDSF